MSEEVSGKTISDMIFDKFAESMAGDASFNGILADLVTAMRQQHGKAKINDLLRKTEDAPSQP